MTLDRNDDKRGTQASSEQPGRISFAVRSAELSIQIGQRVKQDIIALYQKCLDDEKYMPSTEELNTLLARIERVDSYDVTYPRRKRGENNGRTYFLRVYTSLLEQNIFEESSKTVGSTKKTIGDSVSGLLSVK